MSIRALRLIPLLLVFALVAASCGDDDGDSEVADDESTPAATTAAEEPAVEEPAVEEPAVEESRLKSRRRLASLCLPQGMTVASVSPTTTGCSQPRRPTD